MPSILLNTSNYDSRSDSDEDIKNYIGEFIVLIIISISVLMCCFIFLLPVINKCQKNIEKKFRNCRVNLTNCYILYCCCFKKYKKTHEKTTKHDYNFLVKDCLIIDKLDKHYLEEDCSICLEKLINNEETVDTTEQDNLLKIKSCGHVFHANCIYPWFDTQFKNNKDSINCPLCRESINILWQKPTRNISEISYTSRSSDLSLFD